MHKSHDSLMKAELVTARFTELIKVRFPWLVLGLGGAMLAGFIVSKFELTLQENIALAFFIPVVAYMSDAIGTQTETIFIRALTDLKFNITKYILREFLVGALLGSILGFFAGAFALFLSDSFLIAQVVAISLMLSMTTATVLACIVPIILKTFKEDPAVGSGPFTTAIQDAVSLIIYFSVAAVIL